MDLKPYHKAVEFLESIFNLPIKDYLLSAKNRSFYLKRLAWFLNLLGDPQNDFKIIHIAGTAGKGTTTHVLHQILQVSGKKVGSYYSPHATSTAERFKAGNNYIKADELARLTNKLKPFLTKAALQSPYGHPSYFETLLALGFLYFKEKKCDYVILEAGLGGTHDATNICLRPVICAITNVSLDHQEILGNTVAKIAYDKAGIIKKGCSFFTTETKPEILKIFNKRCESLKVPFYKINGKNNPDTALAQAMAEKLGLKQSAIKYGLKAKGLPCRMEIMQRKPLVILDGSHNPAKLKYFAGKLKQTTGKKCAIIFGMSEDKDTFNSLKQIIPLANELILTRFLLASRKSADLKKLTAEAKKIKPSLPVAVFIDPWQALNYALAKTKSNNCLVVTGSFFLAGELRTHWISEEQILKD